jgi:hypothetical protein
MNLTDSWYYSLDGGWGRREATEYTGQQKHKIKTQTNTHAWRGIRTHDPSARAVEIFRAIDRMVTMTSSYKYHGFT